MPCLSGNYNPAVGVLVQVPVLDISQLQAVQHGGGATAQSSLALFMAMLDTGASCTCISNNVIKALGLAPSGKTTMSGSTGQTVVDQYTFILGFLFGAQQTATGGVSGTLQSHVIQGCEFKNHGFGFDVLVGRDILCRGVLNMSFDGHFTLSF